VTDLAERSWLDDAACRGMDAELFFPGRGEPSAAAKAVCRPCPVRFDCLSYALNNGEKHGIWGGAQRTGTSPTPPPHPSAHGEERVT
jgi:WhiB family redox-sensing transcriptional regulator